MTQTYNMSHIIALFYSQVLIQLILPRNKNIDLVIITKKQTIKR
jgi:hypothetical protein